MPRCGSTNQLKATKRQKALTSTMMRGCRPSPRYRSACFMSSPMNSTVDVVPSLQAQMRSAVKKGHSRRACGRFGPQIRTAVQGKVPLRRRCTECVRSPAGVVLRDGCPGDHDRRRVLDLHLPQQHVAVLRELDVCGGGNKPVSRCSCSRTRCASSMLQVSLQIRACRCRSAFNCLASQNAVSVSNEFSSTSSSANEHFDCALRPQVGLHDVAQPLCRIDVHEQRGGTAHDLRLGVQSLDRRHGECLCCDSGIDNRSISDSSDGSLLQ